MQDKNIKFMKKLPKICEISKGKKGGKMNIKQGNTIDID